MPYGLYEPGMWWNLDIFGKFALEIRMDYWYLWKTHFLNFRDFQESPTPLKIPIPTPASDHLPIENLGKSRNHRGFGVCGSLEVIFIVSIIKRIAQKLCRIILLHLGRITFKIHFGGILQLAFSWFLDLVHV